MSEFKDDNPEKTKETIKEDIQTVDDEPNEGGDKTLKIGEREFNSVDDLSKSWEAGQDHIKKIEAENQALRNKQIEQKTIDDLMKRIDNQHDDQTDEHDDEEQAEKVDISALIAEKLTERDVTAKANSNYTTCMSEARTVLGVNFIDDLKQKSIDLFGSESRGVDLAKESPNAFKKLFLSGSTPMKPTSSNFNSSSFQGGGKKIDYFAANKTQQAAILNEERIAMKKELGLI